MSQVHQMTAQELYNKLKNIKVGGSVCQYSLKKCEEFLPTVNEILRLKHEQNAVILVHSYPQAGARTFSPSSPNSYK